MRLSNAWIGKEFHPKKKKKEIVFLTRRLLPVEIIFLRSTQMICQNVSSNHKQIDFKSYTCFIRLSYNWAFLSQN